MKVLKQSSVEEEDAKVHTSRLPWICNQSQKVEQTGCPLTASADLPEAEWTGDRIVLLEGWGE